MGAFTIIKDYLKELIFLSPHTPTIFFNNDDCQSMLAVNIDIRYSIASDNLFDVTLAISLNPTTKDKEVFSLKMEYSSIVTLNLPNDVDEKGKRHVLMVEVPQSLYSIARDVVAQLTLRSGFPPVNLQNFDFEQNYQSKYNSDIISNDTDKVDLSTEIDVEEEFTYQTVVSSFTDTIEGEEFVQTCVSHGMNPSLSFEETPMYKYLMRFIEVPEFNYPLISKADVNWNFFETLYRMLVLDENASYRFAIDEVLELYVTYGEIIDKPISQMDISELDSLATSIIINSWVNYNVPLSQIFSEEYQSTADEYINILGINKMITKNEYLDLFRKAANPITFDWDQVQHWYLKLQELDLSTIKFRF